MGLLAWEQKDYKKAGQLFGDLYKTNPKDARGLMGVVETLASEDRMNDAIAEMAKAAQAEPDRLDLKIGLANLYTRAQKYDQAIDIYKALVDKQPKSADLLYKLGETYRRKGDINLAIDYIRRSSSEAAPGAAGPLVALGLSDGWLGPQRSGPADLRADPED